MTLNLSYNLHFEDLYSRDGIEKIHAEYLATNPPADLLEEAKHVEDFIAELFNVRTEAAALKAKHDELAPIYLAKKLFVQRQLKKYLGKAEGKKPKGTIPSISEARALSPQSHAAPELNEINISKQILKWMDEGNEEMLIAAAYEIENNSSKYSLLTDLPKKLDFENLVHNSSEALIRIIPSAEREGKPIEGAKATRRLSARIRSDFKLTDDGGSLEETLAEANYCIFCHNQGKDSCSKGLWEEPQKPKISPTQVPLAGCPLEEHISEMNSLKADGFSIAALAVVTINNPLCAATGHRICNDCMKSCIYQKQEPVDIPKVETRNLRDVLGLPYGFEIYSLLTRWNPLNKERPVPKPPTGKNVLVVGMGPAGFNLSHHLMNDGHNVMGIDGLKIEPLPQEILTEPIKDISEIWEELDERILYGFGGVAEYGITVRWDKNFLKLIRILLERRNQFSLIGGVRFGGNLTSEQAFEMGFDHIALCMGAGKPTIVPMKNALARGVRTASDFLMSLQLTGAAKESSIANLTLRSPILVIGGGLTAIDASTEALAYYRVQARKFKNRYEVLCKEIGREAVEKSWNEEEKIIAEEFLQNNPEPESSIVYRRRLQDSPAYRLNHEEVEKAFEEGIGFIENATPLEVVLDKFGHAEGLKVNRDGKEEIIPAKTILIAAGTSPNTVLSAEDDSLELDGKYFQMRDENGNKVKPEWIAKPAKPNVLMHLRDDGKAISFFGDLHPDFAGNVVKAMASAKQGYPVISGILEGHKSKPVNLKNLKNELQAKIYEVHRLAPNIIEVVLHAPLAARNFQPGQFYRLQNFETNALSINDTTLATEGMAMTGAWVDKEKELISTIVLEMGGSSDLCAYFKKDEEVVLMGPTGTPTEIPKNENVVLCGGGLGNAVLFSIGKAMRENGCKIVYFAGYRKEIDRYKIEEIEAAADVIIWCCDEKELSKNRPQDFSYKGNIIECMEKYFSTSHQLSNINRLIAIGSDKMMAAIAFARHNQLKEYLSNCKIAIGSINSPMQCMMKEICAQCLQRHVDPKTGEESYVYSCFNQDQCLDNVDFDHLNSRLKQNSLQEKLTAMWIDYCLKSLKLREAA